MLRTETRQGRMFQFTEVGTYYADFKTGYAGVLTPSQISIVIETIFLGIPLPSVYLDLNSNEVFGNGYIVEAFKNFISNEFKIQNLTGLLDDLSGKTYNDIGRPLQRTIAQTMFPVQIIHKSNDCEQVQKYRDIMANVCFDKNYVVRSGQ